MFGTRGRVLTAAAAVSIAAGLAGAMAATDTSRAVPASSSGAGTQRPPPHTVTGGS
jgi:hypothetical protein